MSSTMRESDTHPGAVAPSWPGSMGVYDRHCNRPPGTSGTGTGSPIQRQKRKAASVTAIAAGTKSS